MNLKIALIGNPNCGKTTLFNTLTGGNAHTGNFPGVTVEKREGIYAGSRGIIITDLPGIYSLSPYSPEEIVSRRCIMEERPDLIINIIDASCLVRGLYLTSQLTELDIPMVIALNMMDEAQAKGIKVNTEGLSLALGIDVIPISALSSKGIDLLRDTVLKTAKEHKKPARAMLYGTEIYGPAEKIIAALGSEGRKITVFSAVRLLENDKITIRELCLNQKETEIVKSIIPGGRDFELEIACLRYKCIERLAEKYTSKAKVKSKLDFTKAADLAATGKFSAFPVFFGVMLLIFFLSFGSLGDFLSDFFEKLLTCGIAPFFKELTIKSGAGEKTAALICDGIIPGVGTVLSFLPRLMILFFFISVLEDSGYMARAAFILDKPLRRLGLSGKAFIPLIMGFGCTAAAVMSARTLENEKSRRLTIMLAPFMSCGARLPVYIVFASVFFPRYKGFAVMLLYLIGIAAAVLSAFLLSSLSSKDNNTDFIMELPPYRLPSAKTVLTHISEKTEEFVSKAFTVILSASVIIWILQNFDTDFNYIPNSGDKSILAALGGTLLPVFKPIGITGANACAALLSGLFAKEGIVCALGVLYGEQEALASALRADFTPLSAFCFLVFVLLYTPCAAAFSAIKKELGGIRQAMPVMCFHTLNAWLVSFLLYRMGLFVSSLWEYIKVFIYKNNLTALFSPADIIITAGAAVLTIYNLHSLFSDKKHGCKSCGKCGK